MDRKGRDPRLNALEEDFFSSVNHTSTNHPSAQDDGIRRPQHVRVVFQSNNTTSTAFLRGFMNPSYYSTPLSRNEGSFWHFSRKEINDLTLATFAFALALALMRVGGIFGILSSSGSLFTLIIEMAIWGTLYIFSLGPAFLLHEMAHKFLARHYGCWAEFRADPAGLKTGILIAAILGIVFMAPGAVMVAGNISRVTNAARPRAPAIENSISPTWSWERPSAEWQLGVICANFFLLKLPDEVIDSTFTKLIPSSTKEKPTEVGVVPFVTTSANSPSFNKGHFSLMPTSQSSPEPGHFRHPALQFPPRSLAGCAAPRLRPH